MSSIFNALRIAAACMATASSLAPGAAHAATDWKGYSGLNCLSQNPGDNLRRSATSHPAIANQGDTAVTVYCPVVRDTAEGGPAKVAAVAVRVVNRHPSALLRCDFASHNQAGLKVDVKSGSVPTGEHTIQLGPLDTHNWGHFSLLCQLPGVSPDNFRLPSYIINYRVDEQP